MQKKDLRPSVDHRGYHDSRTDWYQERNAPALLGGSQALLKTIYCQTGDFFKVTGVFAGRYGIADS